MKKFIEELKRRNVIKSTVAYLVFAWLLLQVFTILLPILNAQDWVLKTLTLILAIGLPIWIVISWVYELTPKGIEKTTDDPESELVSQATNKRLNAFIITGLSVAVLILSLNLIYSSSDADREYSLAVIPFNNIRVDENNEWLSQNFTKNVNTYLSKVKELMVIDSYSSSQFEDTDKTNAEIGIELDVSYILRGHLTQLNNILSVTVELIDVTSNKLVRSVTFDQEIKENFLKLSQELAQKIVAELKLELTPEDERVLDNLLTKNKEANIYFNRGVSIADLRGPHNMDSIVPLSVAMFQKAIDIDPDYADAYAEMAMVLRLLTEDNTLFKNTDKFSKVDSLLNKSLELDPNNVRALTTLGIEIPSRGGSYKEGKAYYDKALSIKPNDATLHHYLGLFWKNKPEPDLNKAIEHLKMAHRLNPFSWPISATLIITLLEADKIEEAEDLFKLSVFFHSNYDFNDFAADAKLKRVVEEKKDWRVAIDRLYNEIEKDSTNFSLYTKLGIAYNEILNDSESYLKYTQKAYELGRLYAQNDDIDRFSNGVQYFFALLKNNHFEDAEQLLRDDYFRSLLTSQWLIFHEFYLHYYQKNYSKAEGFIDRWLYDKKLELLILYARQDQVEKVDSILDITGPNANYKATVFAIQEERDSMYYYLNKDNIDFRPINGSVEFNPYRKEERFKALLKKHYLPFTHWNE